MKWLVTQEPAYQWVVEAESLEEASERLDEVLFMTGVVRRDPQFKLIEKP